VPELRVDRRRLLLPCKHTANRTNGIISNNKRKKELLFSP
jgi:hypothetical protein